MQLRELLPTWTLAPLVNALQTLRGVADSIAMSLVAELGDLQRFDNPKQLMAYLGLVPGEYSSGCTSSSAESPRQVTRSCGAFFLRLRGPTDARRRSAAECDDAWRMPSEPLKAIAWKAQVRLWGRYRGIVARGKKHQVAVTAIARELLGFVWAIARATFAQADNA